MTGTVTEWDERAGFGTVTAEDGRSYFFHCTQIANGSRTITIGAAVRFAVMAGHLGRWEAAHVEEL